MAGGPGGTGSGVESGSLFWAIVMSAFAGNLSSYNSPVLTLMNPQRLVVFFSGLSSTPSLHRLGADLVQL